MGNSFDCPTGFTPVKADRATGANGYSDYCLGGSGDDTNILQTPEGKPKGEYDGFQLIPCVGMGGTGKVSVDGFFTGDEIRHFTRVTGWDSATRVYLDKTFLAEAGHVCLNMPDSEGIKTALNKLKDQCNLPGDACKRFEKALDSVIPSRTWEIAAGVVGTDLLAAMTFEPWKELHLKLFRFLNPANLYRGAATVFSRSANWLLARRLGDLTLGTRFAYWGAWMTQELPSKIVGPLGTKGAVEAVPLGENAALVTLEKTPENVQTWRAAAKTTRAEAATTRAEAAAARLEGAAGSVARTSRVLEGGAKGGAAAGRFGRMAQVASESRAGRFLGGVWGRVPGPVKVAAGLAAVVLGVYEIFKPSDAGAAEMPEGLRDSQAWLSSREALSPDVTSPDGQPKPTTRQPTVEDHIIGVPDTLLEEEH